VLNTEKATRSGVKYIEELLQNNKIENTALILNNIKAKKWRYYYNKYGYRYGYGYGYGSGYGYGYGTDDGTAK
jgi:hypothetical protein